MSEQQLVTILSAAQAELIDELHEWVTRQALPIRARGSLELAKVGKLIQHRVYFDHTLYGKIHCYRYDPMHTPQHEEPAAYLIAAGKEGWVSVDRRGIVEVSESYEQIRATYPDLFTRFQSTIAKVILSGCSPAGLLNTLDAAILIEDEGHRLFERLMGEWHGWVVRAVDAMVLISDGQFPCWYEDELGVLSNWESPEMQAERIKNAFKNAGIDYDACIEAAGDPTNGWKYFMETLDNLFGLSDETLLSNMEVVATLFDILMDAIDSGAAPGFIDVQQMQKHLTMAQELDVVSKEEDHLTVMRNIFKHYQALGDFDTSGN